MPIYPTISKYSQAIISTVTVATIFLAYHFYVERKSKEKKRLKRSNARRQRPRRIWPQQTTTSTTSTTTNTNTNTATAAATTSNGTLTNVSDQNTTARTQSITDPNSAAPANEDTLIESVELQVILNEDNPTAPGNAGTSSRGPISDLENEFPYPSENTENGSQNQNLLKILYLIAEDQAKREGYVHRGVTCNSCQAQPIRGIRYRCANCVDFDLCEDCEAQETHPKTHLFYKVRIPAQFLGNPRHVQPLSYPGKPQNMPSSLAMEVVKEFEKKTGFDQAEVEALYEQFKCLAATEYPTDPYKIGYAISRQTFDKFFYPTYSSRPPPPNLIYDRMFALYDTNNDGLIGFEEFILGLAALNTRSRNDEKWKRIFKGYDLDGDGYVDRKDFLKVFRAYYALSKDHVQDIVASMEEDVLDQNQIQTIIMGSQPISAAFPNSLDPRQVVREGKTREQEDGDEELVGNVILPDGTDVATAQDLEDYRKHVRPRNQDGILIDLQTPPNEADAFQSTSEVQLLAELEGITNAESNVSVASDEDLPVTDDNDLPVTDDNDLDIIDSDNENDEFSPDEAVEHSSYLQSIIAEDQELAPEAEKDIGSEILYQVTQEGLNELLNTFFLKKEELALEVERRKKRREKKQQAVGNTGTPTNDMPSASDSKKEEERTIVSSQSTTDVSTADETISNSPTPQQPLAEPSDAESGPSNSETNGHAVPPATEQPETPEPGNSSNKPTKKKTGARDKAAMEQKEKELDVIEKEIEERGGPGRLNYAEFEEIMKQENWRKFAFVGSWVEMASF